MENVGLVETKGIQLITRRIILGVPLIYKFASLFLRNITGLSKPGICIRGVKLLQTEVESKTCPLFVAPRNFQPTLGGPFGFG